jgi:phosphate transport system permease protein
MTSSPAVAAGPVPPASPRGNKSHASWRLTDRLGLAFAWLLGILFCLITAAIVLYLFFQGIRYLRPSLLVTNPTAGYSQNQTGGFFDPLLDTVVIAVMAMTIAIPIGISIAVWLSEFGRPSALARVVESTIEMLAGTPSILLALFGTLLFEAPWLGFLSRTSGGVVFGRSFFAAAAMLSLLAVPLVVTSVREGLQAIPSHVREASYAVGKTKAATTRRVLLPAARPAVLTGSMLGLGRVIGDTAIVVLLLGNTLTNDSSGSIPILSALRGTGSTLTSYVYYNAPTGDGDQPAKAYAAAFVLLLIVLALNVGVDLAGRRGKDLRWSS